MSDYAARWLKFKNPIAGSQRLGVEAALQACDTAFANAEKAKDEKSLGNVGTAIANAKTKVGAWAQLMKAELAKIQTPKPGVTVTPEQKAKFKTDCEVAGRGLAGIISSMEAQLKSMEVMHNKELSGLEFMAKTFFTTSVAAVKRAQAFVAQVKSKKGPEKIKTFNAGVQKAARDITQQLGNAPKLEKEGLKFKTNPKDISARLTPWAQSKKLADTASDKDVNDAVAELTACIDDTDKWLKANTPG